MRIRAWIVLSLPIVFAGCSGCEPEIERAAPLARPAPEPEREPTTVRRIGKRAVVPVETPGPRPPARAPEAPSDWRLDHSDPELRLEAVEALEPEGDGLRALAGLLQGDPDPGVRAAAAQRMETSVSPEAVGSLLVALGDPEPEVVLAAIESLEFVADERIVADLARYRNHSDPEVREAVEDAIEFLE